VAAAVDRVHRDRGLADRLVAAGHRRLGDFAASRTAARFVEVLGGVAGAPGAVA